MNGVYCYCIKGRRPKPNKRCVTCGTYEPKGVSVEITAKYAKEQTIIHQKLAVKNKIAQIIDVVYQDIEIEMKKEQLDPTFEVQLPDTTIGIREAVVEHFEGKGYECTTDIISLHILKRFYISWMEA